MLKCRPLFAVRLILLVGACAAACSDSPTKNSVGPEQPGVPIYDPEKLPPPARGIVTRPGHAARFLWEYRNAPQMHVTSGAIAAHRTSVLTGRVKDPDGNPLEGVKVTLVGLPEYGETQTKADGNFAMGASGGQSVVVSYQKEGYLAVQREVGTEWQDYTVLPEIVMTQPSQSSGGEVDLTKPEFQIVQGDVVKDSSGERQATVGVPSGTKVYAVLPDGSGQELTKFHVRITEYTRGDKGPQQMPADLPPATGYTYASEFYVDEADKLGATRVEFEPSVFTYLDNFLSFPVGTSVPAGAYNRNTGVWESGDSGQVIAVLNTDNGIAAIDSNGDGKEDNENELSKLSVTPEERQKLAKLYQPGKTLWRISTPHFSPWDFNFGFGLPPGASYPGGGGSDNSNTDDPCEQAGASVIECQNQILGEDIPLVGTSFSLHYHSDRVPGTGAQNTLSIPLMGAQIPPELKQIRVEALVAGQESRYETEPSVNAKWTYVWDGKDVFGRPAQGRQPATVKIGYVYAGSYQSTARFGQPPYGYDSASINVTRKEVVLWSVWRGWIGSWDAHSLGMGGWSLNEHHVYDAQSGTLYFGNGRRRSVATRTASRMILEAPFRGSDRVQGQYLTDIRGVAPAPDGSVYVATSQSIFKMSQQGTLECIAGKDYRPDADGDGGPATDAHFNRIRDIALARDGSLLISDATWVRRISRDGVINRIAGGGIKEIGEDGTPGSNARLPWVNSMAIGPDGSLYMVNETSVVTRLGPDGRVYRFAGTGETGFGGDGGPANRAKFNRPWGVAVTRDGNVYISDTGNHRIRRVSPDGRVVTIAGTGEVGYSGDDGPAASAKLNNPRGLSWRSDGSLAVADSGNRFVRVINSGGIISTIAGRADATCAVCEDIRVPPRTAGLEKDLFRVIWAPDSSLWLTSFTSSYSLRHIMPAMPRYPQTEVMIPSDDGSEVFAFDSTGRHLRTVDALTGVTALTFNYDGQGLLSNAVDELGNTTTFGRDPEGNATTIIGPYGKLTSLRYLPSGDLGSVTNPVGEAVRLTYSVGGLIETLVDPEGWVNKYSFDESGRLVSDTKASGQGWKLERTAEPSGWSVQMTTALGRIKTHKIAFGADGSQTRTTVFPDGTKVIDSRANESKQDVTYPSGMRVVSETANDRRFGGGWAPYVNSIILTAGPKKLRVTREKIADLADPKNPLSLRSLTDKLSINGQTSTVTYSAADKTIVYASPAGRKRRVVLDVFGRVARAEFPGELPEEYHYDARGRLDVVTQGTRSLTYSYGPDGLVQGVKNALGQNTTYENDPAERLTKLITTDGSAIGFGYDHNSNLLTLIPPGRDAHRFSYGPSDLLLSHTPPEVPGASSPARYSYRAGEDITDLFLPDGSNVTMDYDVAGRLASIKASAGILRYGYDPATGLLKTVTGPDTQVISYDYQAGLLTKETSAGAVEGAVEWSFDDNLRVASEAVAADRVEYAYDSDGLVKVAGKAQIGRSPATGQVESTTILSCSESFRRDQQYGELASQDARCNGASLYAASFVRDDLGRITSVTEIIAGTSQKIDFAYDAASRISEVSRAGSGTTRYAYDGNGNRTQKESGGKQSKAIYDAQDRLQSYGQSQYVFNANGDLVSTAEGDKKTECRYDVFGNLLEVQKGGKRIEYVVDGLGRRIGKRVDGTLVKKWLYRNSLKPVAELDGAGKLLARFVYGSRTNVPDYMEKGGKTYKIVSDWLGNPRLVIDARSGLVGQRLDYDEYGIVQSDSAPGFQPFGYAGGLYDPDTGLVRLGARDYDAETGRWTSKDPLSFGGGDTNLYGYVDGDPINYADINGLNPIAAGALAGAASGAVQGAVESAMNQAFDKPCIDWGEVGKAALSGAAWGAAGGALGGFAFSRGSGGGCRGAGCGGPPQCFASGTAVQTQEGPRPIEAIQLGDLVWSRDEASGQTALRSVVRVFERPGAPLVQLTLVSETGEEDIIRATPEHPFRVDGWRWLQAGELKPGDILSGMRDGVVEVASAASLAQPATVYNFEVDNFHTYFVGEIGAWVHNTCPGRAAGGGKARNGPPGPLPEAEGRPHTIIERSGPSGQYTSHNGDGTYKQYRGSGQDHGGIPRPNVKENKLNSTPDGRAIPGKPTVRPARPDEIPGGG